MEQVLLNGNKFAYAAIELSIAGTKYYQHKALEFSGGPDPQLVFGAGFLPVGFTYDDASNEGSITWDFEEWAEMLASIGDAPLQRYTFDILASFADEGERLKKVELIGCRFGPIDFSGQRGPDALEMTTPFKWLNIKIDGKFIYGQPAGAGSQ